MTTYFVSGFMRSGTSMMMKALEAGGLDAAKNPKQDQWAKKFADEHYSPNEGGLYELHRSQYREFGFPQKFKGKLIKCLYGGIGRIAAVDDFKIVFMRRDIEEIKQSYTAFFGQEGKPELFDDLAQRLDLTVKTLEQRRDIDLVQFWYRDVVDHPTKKFSELREHGWAIDPVAAAATVDPEQCRYRREKLTISQPGSVILGV